jgi:hypothetical protein
MKLLADWLQLRDLFRFLFEIYLAIWAALLGATFSTGPTSKLHWTFLGVTGISWIFFLSLSLCCGRRGNAGV